jgi:EAL and modified HD-GYP domain-containing signal transduction protein
LALDPIPHRFLVQRPSYERVVVSRNLKGARGRDDHRSEMPTASHAVPAAPAREVLVARQPVLDAEMNLLGFELLVHGAAVVADALSEVGLEKLTGGHAAWLPLGREMLLDVGPVPVRSDRVVLQVQAAEGDEDAIVEAVRQLAERGACVALDRFEHRPALAPLLDLAWGVKIDLAAHGADGLRAQVGALAGRDLVLIATSVDTNEDLALCRALGFHAFQGAFLAEPEIVPGRAVPTQGLDALGSLADLQGSIEFEDLERAIVRDVGLSHKLLRYANSALFARSQRVGSVREALTMLGARPVRRWATALVMAGMPDQPHALLVTALVRARMCELLSDDAARADRAFTVGMFSTINRLLGLPMREALETLPLADDVIAALLRGEGAEGGCLRTILAWELGDFAAAQALPGGAERVARAYRDAVTWADDTAAQITA